MWETFCRQKTTRHLWQSFGGLAPLAAGSVLLVFLVRRSKRERLPFRDLVFFHFLLVVGMLLTNTVKQQMFWYIIPGVIPPVIFIALVVWAALTGRVGRFVYLCVCVLVFLGTCLPGVYTAPMHVWIVRISLLLAVPGAFLPADLKRAGRTMLVVALVFAAWGGMSFENRNVNFTIVRDSADLKHLGQLIAGSDYQPGPLVLDFKHYPMNTLMFYSGRTAIQAPELPESDLEACYGVFEDKGYEEIPGYKSQMIKRSGKYDLVELKKTE
jgi:hypothetical protein